MFFAQIKSLLRPSIRALAFLALTLPVSAQRVHPAPQPPPKNAVRAEGCVRAGVEPRCILLRDVKTGHLYNLLFKAAPPPVGLGIEFTGVLHSGPTHCMQGTAVEVLSWAHKASIQCAPGQAGEHGRSNPQ
jgi:hypothetical protein